MEGSLHATIPQSPTSKPVFREISYCTSKFYAGDAAMNLWSTAQFDVIMHQVSPNSPEVMEPN